MTSGQTTLDLHASCVAWQGRALLITGASGSGKSALALDLMAYGCDLVADDRTILTRHEDTLVCTAPAVLRGRIEARFVGILNAEPVSHANLVLALNLDHDEESRLPPLRSVTYLGVTVPLNFRPRGGHSAASILQYLKAGRSA